MFSTVVTDIRALANHFSGLHTQQPNSSPVPVTSTPTSHVPLPRSGGHHVPSSGLVSIDGQPHHHQHRRSVVADVAYLQGVHNHHPLGNDERTAAQRTGPSSSSTSAAAEENPRSNLRELIIHTIHKKVIGRVIIVGDVHGCPDQLRELARLLHYDKTLDLLIIAGDLVNKGPDSHGAVRAAMDLGAKCVLGNHDATVLELWEQIHAKELDGFSRKASRDPAVRVARDMTDDCIQYLQQLPHVIKVPQYNLQVLHAGLNLSYKLEDQSIRDVTHLRRLEWNDEKNRYDSIAKGAHGDLWAKLYSGPEIVVFGHDARTGLQDEKFAIGLDTGCCYGGALTAVVFPGRKFVSVPGLPKENRMKVDEDFDETASRLDTPAAPAVREPSPAPSSFYDPVSISNRSTPYSTTMPNGVDVAFPMAPSVQQFFQKHRQTGGDHQASPPQSIPVAQSPVEEKRASLVYSQAAAADRSSATDPIGYLRSLQDARGGSPIVAQRAFTPPMAKPQTPTTRTVGEASKIDATSIQLATLKTLVKGQHAKAIVALLQTDLYRGTWESMLEDEDDTTLHAFWSSVVDMIVAHTEREKTTLTDDTLELVDLLIEVLGEKRNCIAPKSIARVGTFANRLVAGELKGLSKGVLKAVQTLLK